MENETKTKTKAKTDMENYFANGWNNCSDQKKKTPDKMTPVTSPATALFHCRFA